jgi:integrase
VYQIVAAHRAPTAERHNPAFPGFRSGSVRVVRWNADGSLAWSVGKHSHLEPFAGAKPGEYHDPTRILGVVHDCVVVADRSAWPASVWTADGLYAGSFLDRRADDGLPANLYSWWREKRPNPDKPGEFVNPQTLDPDTPIPFDVLGGFLLPLPGSDPLWMPMGESASAVYRVGGWTNWERHEGRVELPAKPPHANAQGTGLTAAYFNNTRLEGKPVHERTDTRIWFGHKIGPGKWLPWSKDAVPGLEAKGFSARWTGFIEPRFTEAFTFSAYIGPTDRVRIWINDELTLDAWTPADPKRRRRSGSRTTWSAAYLPYLRRLAAQAGSGHPQPFGAALLEEVVESYGLSSRSRQQCAIALAALARHQGLDLPADWSERAAGYGLHAARFRQLPSDAEILTLVDRIPNEGWRLAYGLMATYGLRNHEVFFCDLSALAPGGDRVIRVLPTSKTGEHQVWPFQPAWVEHFGLERLGRDRHALPPVSTDLGRTTLQQVGRRVAEQFRRYELPITPYDLRHAWAVRTIHVGLPDTVAARMMGHSVGIHTRTYHHWITRRDQQQAVDAALQRLRAA